MAFRREGPGFPLTRKRARGSRETFCLYVILTLLGIYLGLDSVELGRLLAFF
jgi:uncharacterized membrane protein YecN with MAPEG domain